MSNLLYHRITRFINYYYKAQTIYNIHSPYLFALLSRMMDRNINYYDFENLHDLREYFKRQKLRFSGEDPGAGSSIPGDNRSIRKIMKHAVSPAWKSEVFYRLLEFYQPKKILELGTSLGLNTLYLAHSNPDITVITIEGNPEIHRFASTLFKRLKMQNITAVCGNIDDHLESILQSDPDINCIIMDANHRLEPTLSYFELIKKHLSPGLVIMDDIHWSPGMTEAWNKCRSEGNFNVDIDFYYFGLLLKSTQIKTRESFSFIPHRYKPWQSGFFN
jgi:predicted O-methyltransferase YrrM